MVESEREDHIVAKALGIVEEIQTKFPQATVSEVASRLETLLRVGLLISRHAELSVILDAIVQSSKVQRSAGRGRKSEAVGDGDNDITAFAKAAAELGVRHGTGATCKTQVFKCLQDYETCAERRGRRAMICLALATICIGKRVIPFAPSEK
jgi:hypothetical protein